MRVYVVIIMIEDICGYPKVAEVKVFTSKILAEYYAKLQVKNTDSMGYLIVETKLI